LTLACDWRNGFGRGPSSPVENDSGKDKLVRSLALHRWLKRMMGFKHEPFSEDNPPICPVCQSHMAINELSYDPTVWSEGWTKPAPGEGKISEPGEDKGLARHMFYICPQCEDFAITPEDYADYWNDI